MAENRPSRGRRERADKPKEQSDLVEKVVFINRCAKVVKGGRRFSFSALIVTGDKAGRVGCGFGKANEVSEAIRKAGESAKKAMVKVALSANTIPHEAYGELWRKSFVEAGERWNWCDCRWWGSRGDRGCWNPRRPRKVDGVE